MGLFSSIRKRRTEKKATRVSNRVTRRATRRTSKAAKKEARGSRRLARKSLKLNERQERAQDRQSTKITKQTNRLTSKENRQDSRLLFRERRLQTRKRSKALRSGTPGVGLTSIPSSLISPSIPSSFPGQFGPPGKPSTTTPGVPSIDPNILPSVQQAPVDPGIPGAPPVVGIPDTGNNGFFGNLTGGQKTGLTLGTLALIGGGALLLLGSRRRK